MALRPVPLLCIAAALVVGIAGQTAPSDNAVNTYNAAGLVTEGKVETCDTTKDYFPWKIPQSTMIKAQFEVTYHKYYKVVKTTGATKKTYLLVQRGCPTPTGVTSDLQVTVPLKNVVLASGSWIGFLEHMGESMAIKGANGFYTTSPCVNKRALASTTEAKIVDMSAYYFNASTSVYQTPAWGTGPKTPDSALTAGIDAHFVDPWSSGKNGIFFGPEGEPTYLAVNEWIHYMSAFFNKEKETSLFSSQSKNRWTCWSGAATGAAVVPKIAWIDYYGVSHGVTTPIGFVVNQCSKKDDASYRFCDMIKAAGGTPVADFTPTVETSPSLLDKENGQLLGVSDEDIKKYVANADLIVFQNQYCGDPITTAEECAAYWKTVVDKLKDTTAYKNQQIYDIGGINDPLGGSGFLEAVTQPEVILQDLIVAIANREDKAFEEGDHRRVYLRKMLTEGTGNKVACADNAAAKGCIPTAQSLADKCTDVAAIPTESSAYGARSTPCSAASALQAVPLLAALSAVFATLFVATF